MLFNCIVRPPEIILVDCRPILAAVRGWRMNHAMDKPYEDKQYKILPV